jgi:molybdate transport system substrate-binding protein
LFACDASGAITVAAAASLTEAFEVIGEQFEDVCEGSEVTFSFDSSGKLAEQILSGAPVDVFASADETTTSRVAEVTSGEPAAFARNRLAIVTQPGNPEGIASLADLVDVGGGVIALCAPDAACGRLAAEALEFAGVDLDESRVTRGTNAKGTLAAVTRGDASAAIVFTTDAAAAGNAVQRIDLPEDQQVIASYPVVVIDGPGDRALAEAFAAYLQDPAAQQVLAGAGFLPAA